MTELPTIDRRAIADGTGRWLWCVNDGLVLVRAGIADSYQSCRHQSYIAYMDYRQAQLPPHVHPSERAEDRVILDLDQLDATGLERDQGGDESTKGVG